jgi:hypothetical protein
VAAMQLSHGLMGRKQIPFTDAFLEDGVQDGDLFDGAACCKAFVGCAYSLSVNRWDLEPQGANLPVQLDPEREM